MSTPLYTEYFGLSARPFTLVPDPAFLYWSAQHQRAFSILEFGLMSRAPITLITGEIGAGKTTLLQALLTRIEDDVTVGLISNAQGGRGELLRWILNALSVPFDQNEDYVAAFQRLQDFLVDEYAAGRRVILIFDEAQNLSVEGLEELRMLTNVNSNQDELVQLVLVGQPELREMVNRPDMRQLAQRISASFHLDVMDSEDVADYISCRLRLAGGSGAEFTADACAMVHRATGGVPRLVNQLSDFAMLYAWSADTPTIDAILIEQVLTDGVFFAGEPAPEGAI